MEEGAATKLNFHDRKEEKMILVQSMNHKHQHGRDRGLPEGGRSYPLSEFHLVDLERNEIHLHYSPPLLEIAPSTTMAALNHVIYLFGGLNPLIVETSVFKLLQSQSPESHQKLFLGGSSLNLDSETGVWVPAPVPVKDQNRCYLKCTSLLGKIYTFGCLSLAPEVLDPSVGRWKPVCPLPPQLACCSVSCYPLPDPSNRRILVHLSGGPLSTPSLYAFTPHSSGGTWKCIAPDFEYWTHVAAVVDDVIYFHSHKFTTVVRAFDLVQGTWLKVHWSSCFDNNVDMNNFRMDFDALLTLGDRILCLAVWSPVYPSDDQPRTDTSIFFPKFRVEPSGETIKAIPLSSPSYVLPATCEVYNFLPI